MNFPDYKKLGGEDGIHCCVTHEDMLKYLNDYADFFDLKKFIQVSDQNKIQFILLLKQHIALYSLTR